MMGNRGEKAKNREWRKTIPIPTLHSLLRAISLKFRGKKTESKGPNTLSKTISFDKIINISGDLVDYLDDVID